MAEPRRVATGYRRFSAVVRALVADQAGVVGRAQLLAHGVTGSALDRALRAGRLHRLHPGVYSLPAPELLTQDALLTAALMAAGRGAILSHGSAAWWWEIIPAPPTTIEVSVPGSRAPLHGVTLFRPTALRPGDVVIDRDIHITSIPRTVLDLAVRYEHQALVRVLEQAEFHHDLRPADILRALRRGHPGSANLRAALDAHAPGHGTAKSDLERAFRRLLIKHAIELPLRNHPVGPYEADCLWPADDRDLWLRRHGYITRRYGDTQINHHPDAVIDDLLTALAQAEGLGLKRA